MDGAQWEVVCGDNLDVLKKIRDCSIHCCVTSPPYFGLRDYGSPHKAWGGDPACVHEWGAVGRSHHPGQVEQSKWKTAEAAGKGQTAGSGQFCQKCTAWLGAFGLEPTPELYVEHAVIIFREVKRVLRDDGSFWLNIGDSYATGGGAVGDRPGGGHQGDRWKERGAMTSPNRMPLPGLKAGDLIGVPWRLALALQADGWYLRSSNIWSKGNPMPESVKGVRWEKCRIKINGKGADDGKNYHQGMAEDGYRAAVTQNPVAEWVACPGCDKCSANDGMVLRKGSWRTTRAHEDVFQFTKTGDYYADGEAVVEPVAEATRKDKRIGTERKPDYAAAAAAYGADVNAARTLARNAIGNGETRNRRFVWQVNSQPFKEAHFAVFPPALIEPCILSSTSEHGVCATCEAPYARVVERTNMVVEPSARREEAHAAGAGSGRTVISGTMVAPATTTTGWRKTCACPNKRVIPALVIDPFNGAGTSGLVATKHGRRYIGIDVNEAYCEMSRRRIGEAVVPPALPVIEPEPPKPVFPPEGWFPHPDAKGWFHNYKECLTEAQLRARMAA